MNHSKRLYRVGSLLVVHWAIIIALTLSYPVASENLLEEVIVTATKRQENLQDVSVAVTALPDSVLDQAQIVNSEDIVALVPSLNLQKGMNPRSSSFNIRGIGTQSFSTAAEPSVSSVVDGVVMGRSGLAFNQLLDVQRVEVLRGPQGTLFGKNSSAGVVHIITKDPSEELEGEVRASIIERGEYRAGAVVSIPLSDSVGVRLTGVASHTDGWIHNVFDDSDRNESDDWSLRGKLAWRISDALDFKWVSDYFRKDCICNQQTVRSIELGVPQVDTLAPVQAGVENTQVNTDGDMFLDVEGHGHAVYLDWQLGDYTLTSITAYRTWDEVFEEDVDNLPVPVLINFDQSGTLNQHQFTQELRLASPADQWLSYVGGLYFFKQDVRRTFERSFVGLTTHSDFTVYTENLAAFGEATLDLADSLRLILGARATRDEIDYDFQSFQGPSDIPIDDSFTPVVFSDGTGESDVSGKLALEFDVNDRMLSYLSFAQGYKGPAFNLTATSQGTRPRVEPEVSDALELGLKTNFLDGNLILNIAVFHTTYDDFQAEAFVQDDTNGDGVLDDQDDGTGVFELRNAGKIITTGIEMDFRARIDRVELFGSASFIDAEIDQFPGGPCSFGQQFRPGECLGGVQDLGGGRMPHTPDWKVNLMASYIQPLERLAVDLKFSLNLQAQDEVQYSISQDPFSIQDGYEIVDFNVAVLDTQDRYELIAYVKNVFDEFYVSGVGATFGLFLPNGYLQSVPKTAERTAGLEFRYRW